MTDHPDAAILEALRPQFADTNLYREREARALDTAIAAIRALQALRPHHPRAVVGNRYALIAVGHDELVAAQEVVGREHDLGRFDLEAAVADVQRAREDYYADDPEMAREKWGGR